MNVYVFGTSVANNYCGVYGQVAREEFGWDGVVNEGLSGRSYAIPVLSSKNTLLSYDIIKENVTCFKIYASLNKDKTFLISDLIPYRQNNGWEYYYESLFKKMPDNCKFI